MWADDFEAGCQFQQPLDDGAFATLVDAGLQGATARRPELTPVDGMAERVGFEPTVSLHPRRFSRPLP